ncbi:MAG: permease [Clostridiales bacterium]
MIILKKLRNNLFFVLIFILYIILFIYKYNMGITALKNSVYYIREMLIIMPVIFILTALLDMWVPKEKILKYLGKEAGQKGILLSFILGSVSAGPIYAAFPICTMLYRKGASIRNLVIILSSWAVIKIPMLLNEMKFLGPKFMIVRWLLTIMAIIIFSWLTAKIIKDKDLPNIKKIESGLSLNKNACIGCKLCIKKYPEIFDMKNKKAYIKKLSENEDIDIIKLNEAIDFCPVKAITK